MPREREVLKLSFDKLPRTVTLGILRTFIIDALESWGGQFHPDDPLFDSLQHVHVTRFKETVDV